MYLFLNGVSYRGYIALISEQREIIADKYFEISGNESTKTIPVIDEFLFSENISYGNISNIITVVGPGSFTGIRTISLVVNTLAYTYPHIFLTAVNFFDLFDQYPIVKSSSKRDLFVKSEKSATIRVQQNHDFISGFGGDTIYGDTKNLEITEKYQISSDINYKEFFGKIELTKNKRVAPLYIKKPTIS